MRFLGSSLDSPSSHHFGKKCIYLLTPNPASGPCVGTHICQPRPTSTAETREGDKVAKNPRTNQTKDLHCRTGIQRPTFHIVNPPHASILGRAAAAVGHFWFWSCFPQPITPPRLHPRFDRTRGRAGEKRQRTASMFWARVIIIAGNEKTRVGALLLSGAGVQCLALLVRCENAGRKLVCTCPCAPSLACLTLTRSYQRFGEW